MYIIVILVLVVIITILEKKLNEKEKTKENENLKINYKEKYTKKDYLLTQNELKFYRILKQITDSMGYSLFCQVALYEIVKNKEYKDFNKIKSKSIDFVITQENCKILMCIELDDNTHEKQNRINRDNFINDMFKDLDIKLLRIPVQNFYNMEELKKQIEESI